MTRDEWLERATKIGRAFTARDMRAHLPQLRAYYVDVRAGREPRTWPDELVIDWAIALQVPPYESVAATIASTRGGRWYSRAAGSCDASFCGRRWLELQRQ